MNSLTRLSASLPVATANWTKTAGGLAYLFTDLRPVHVLQNSWCARPVCSMNIGPCVAGVSDCHIMISVASVVCMRILHTFALHCTRSRSPHNVMHSPSHIGYGSSVVGSCPVYPGTLAPRCDAFP